MSTPKVSIIVPIYNVERYLERCIKSLINQTLKEIEIILVDDGSPDKCPQICDDYAQKDNRIKVIHKTNEGLGLARNSGMEIATGEYIAFVDSDDYVSCNMYSSLFQETLSTKYDVVYCGVNAEKKDKKIYKEHIYNLSLNQQSQIHDFLGNIIASEPKEKCERKGPMAVWHAIYKKRIIDTFNIRFLSERIILSEDILFDIKYLSHCQSIRLIPQALYYYCYNGESLSQTFKPDKITRTFALYEEMMKTIQQLNLQDYDLRVKRFFIGYIRGFLKQIFSSSMSINEKKILCYQIYNYKKWDSIYNSYPIKDMPIYHKVILLTTKKKAYYIQLILFYLLNKL